MFQYFPNNYSWSIAVACSIGMGGEMSEIDEACRPLLELQQGRARDGATEAWYQNWERLGQKLLGLAEHDERAGRRFTAASKYLRAANYFLFAERNMSWSDERRLQVYGIALQAFRSGVMCSGEAVERVDIDYEGRRLSGWLRLAEGKNPQPAIIFYNGFDSIKEMHYLLYAQIAARRGISTLFVDQEGTGEAIRYYGLTKRHDTEVSAGKFFDALTANPAIDSSRIGIVGLSMGGYCAPRAAAFDKRFKCVASLGAFYKLDDDWERLLGGGADANLSDGLPESGLHAMRVTGASTVTDAIARLKQRSLEGVLGRIECPLLVVHGENDRQVALWHAQRTVAEAVNSSRAELKVFSLTEGGAEHCGLDVMSLPGQYVFDWAAEQLGGRLG
jgi:fermentation-respiration switch protein FrsA (DUF1100 family)